MSLTKDGSVVIAAPARNINGENEVDAVKLDADGYVVRRWQVRRVCLANGIHVGT